MLHEFGTPAYVHVEKSNRKKWDNKARIGIYVGRDEHSNADRVYFADTNRVVTSANVVFTDQRLLDEGVTTSDAPTSAADDDEADIAEASTNNSSTNSGSTDDIGAASEGGTNSSNSSSNTSTDTSDDEDDCIVSFKQKPQRQHPTNDDDWYNKEDDLFSTDDDEPANALQVVRGMAAMALAMHSLATDPLSFGAAMQTPQAEQWKSAILEEANVILANETWELINVAELPPGTVVLGSKFVFKDQARPGW